MTSTSVYDVTPCSLVEVYCRFGGTRKQAATRIRQLAVNVACLRNLLFDTEDGFSTSLRNVGKLLPHYMIQLPLIRKLRVYTGLMS
jgi:hypothetical protein